MYIRTFKCFFCQTEEEFDDLCHLIQEDLIASESQPLFELSQERQQDWIPATENARCALETIMCNGNYKLLKKKHSNFLK